MATKRRKSRKRRSCKHGKLKRPVRTKKGGKRRCKKTKSRKKSKRRKRKRKYKMQREDSWGFTEEDDARFLAEINRNVGRFEPNNFTTQETRQLQQNFAQQQAQRQQYMTGLGIAQNQYNDNTTPEEQQTQAQGYTERLKREADAYNQSMGIRNQLNKIQRQIESNQANQAAIGYPATQQNQLATLQNQQNQLATLPAGFQAAYVNNELDIQGMRSRAEHEARSQTYLRYVMLTEGGDTNPPHPPSVPFGQWPPSQSSNFIFEGQNQPGFIPSQQLVDDDTLKQMWQVAGHTVFPDDIPDQRAIGQDMRLMIERGRALEEERRNQLSRVDTETLHYLSSSQEEFVNIMSQPIEQQEQYLQQRLGSIASDFQQLLQQAINENNIDVNKAQETQIYTQEAVNSRDYVDRVEKVVEDITGNESSLRGRPTFWTPQPQLQLGGYQAPGMLGQ